MQQNMAAEPSQKPLQEHSYRFQLSLRFILHPPDVLHCEVNPPVNPAEELAMEVGKYPFFLL